MQNFIDLTPIFNAFIAFLGTIITYYLLPLIKTIVVEKQHTYAKTWIMIAVTAAEQLYSSNEGSVKMQYVIDFLGNLNIKVTTQEIESAVFELKNQVLELF